MIGSKVVFKVLVDGVSNRRLRDFGTGVNLYEAFTDLIEGYNLST